MSATRPMAAVDAQMWWMSAVLPSDQFLLYAFDGSPGQVHRAVDELRTRALACGELRLRVVDDRGCRYPRWEPTGVSDDQFAVHRATGWQGCLDAVRELAGDQLDLRRSGWRAHVFPDVEAVPGATGAGSVVVVQIGHAYGDGTRSAALAAALLGRDGTPATVAPADPGRFVLRAWQAARAHRRLVADTEAGLLPPPAPLRPLLSINDRPRGVPVIRTLAVARDRLPGPTVTVGALVVIAEALAGLLAARGEDPRRLGAEIPMAGPLEMHAHNNFRNVGIGLHPDHDRAGRAALINAEFAAHRRRGAHPATRASTAAFAAVPAPLLRWGLRRFDPTARSPAVTGNTVVSSVNRGPADLSFGGHPVVLTAGYPALSPMMSLTHGVHGIGDTVAVSVHADPANVDVDDYADRLSAAIGR